MAAGLLMPCSSSAQQGAPDAAFVARRAKKQSVETETLQKPPPYDISGVVAQAFKMKKPLELLNPLAPKKYDSMDDVTWDPDNPEKPKGIILFGIQW